jgi:phage tail sheath gpL-like
MNRTTHLQAQSAFGAARLWACGIVGVVAQRSAGNPAKPI